MASQGCLKGSSRVLLFGVARLVFMGMEQSREGAGNRGGVGRGMVTGGGWSCVRLYPHIHYGLIPGLLFV